MTPATPPTTAVWIDAGGTPGEDAARALTAWAKARGVELAQPADASTPALPVAWDAAEGVEKELASVRDALAGLELEAAEHALERAGATLRDHPELPQAAWLRAEVDRAWATRWLRGGDEAQAKRAWQRATGLDGGRAPGLGERAFEPGATIGATIRLAQVEAGDAESTLRLDGVPMASGPLKRTEGEHVLAIVGPDGRVTQVQWIALAEGADVPVTAPEPPPCSARDVRRARRTPQGRAGDAIEASGVRCQAWVAVVPALDGAVRVATCEAGSCGALIEWRSIATGTPGWTFEPTAPPASEPHFRWPAWATWTLVGVGVAGGAVGIAAAAGAFKGSPATETQFVNGGIQVRAFGGTF